MMRSNEPSDSISFHFFFLYSLIFYYLMTDPLFEDNSAAKVRRLYDIANVLSSMNLIEKVKSEVGSAPY